MLLFLTSKRTLAFFWLGPRDLARLRPPALSLLSNTERASLNPQGPAWRKSAAEEKLLRTTAGNLPRESREIATSTRSPPGQAADKPIHSSEAGGSQERVRAPPTGLFEPGQLRPSGNQWELRLTSRTTTTPGLASMCLLRTLRTGALEKEVG